MMATINVMLNIAVLVSVNTPCMAFRALGNPTFSTNQLNIGGALFNSDTKRTSTVHCQATRRDVCSCLIPASLALATLIVPNDPSLALSDTVTDDDLTTKMFNIDGSLKEGISSEVKYRNVSFKWDESDEMSMHKDGIDTRGTSGSQYMLDYQYPMRWSDGKDGDPIYFDRSEGINTKVAKGITIYQAPGKFKDDRLQRATTIGVAKAVNVPEDFPRLYKADTVSGRTVEKGSQIYYEFDMAAAPDTCGESNENLGLGFCPYDDLFLLSATVINDRLYCMIVECDSTKLWKIESKELKRIRSSFTIEEAANV